MSKDPDKLKRRIGFEFRRDSLLDQALTHRSLGGRNNERLEFLGDAVLGLVVGEAVWHRFEAADEGQLSRLRAALVRKETLAEVAREIALGDYLRLGAGELRTGGHMRDSILADGVEAVIGAAYLDQGFDAARGLVLGLFEERITALDLDRALKDPKTRLQEWLQAKQRPLPRYEVVGIDGDQHRQQFAVRCALEDQALGVTGRGTSRRRAEQQAAENMLARLDSRD